VSGPEPDRPDQIRRDEQVAPPEPPPEAPPLPPGGWPGYYGPERFGPGRGGRGRLDRHGPDPRDRDRYYRRERYRHWSRRTNERPPWWPDDESWPPEGEFPWRRMRRLFLIRFAIGVFLIFALIVAGPLIVIGQILGATGLSSPASVIVAFALLMLIFFAIAGTARGARRFALPFGALIEAAARVEGGDYSARVPEVGHGPRELKALVTGFNSMAERLEQDEQQRRTLLADVSRELRTPLAVLQGELEAMIDGVHPTDEAHLSAAVEEIRMLTGLVEDLRTLTLAEAGTLALHRETTDLSILAQEVATSFDSIAAGESVHLAVEMPGDVPLMDVDPLRIRQVLGNLVANALRYAPAGSSVRITGEHLAAGRPGPAHGAANPAIAGRERVRLSVLDQGPGIAPDVLPHLFDRFAKSAESRGSGLGLAIARRLVEAHGGSIWVEQPAGGGTAIRFEVPVAPGA
jgi:signal transduction histidine kinase